jgi:hypothetical protein
MEKLLQRQEEEAARQELQLRMHDLFGSDSDDDTVTATATATAISTATAITTATAIDVDGSVGTESEVEEAELTRPPSVCAHAVHSYA